MSARFFFFPALVVSTFLLIAGCPDNGDGGNGTAGTGGYGSVAAALVPEVSLRPDPKGDSLGTALPLASDLRAYGNRAESFSAVDVANLDLAYACSTQDESLLVLCGGNALPSGTLRIAQSQFWARVPLTDSDSCSSYSVAFGEREYGVRWDASGQRWQLAVTSTDINAPSSVPSAARAVLEGDTLTWLIPSSEVDGQASVKHSSSVDSCGDAAPLGRDVVAMHPPISDRIASQI